MSYVMWDMHSIDLSNAGKKIIDRLIRFFQNDKKDKKNDKKVKKNNKKCKKMIKKVKKTTKKAKPCKPYFF